MPNILNNIHLNLKIKKVKTIILINFKNNLIIIL